MTLRQRQKAEIMHVQIQGKQRATGQAFCAAEQLSGGTIEVAVALETSQ